MALVSAATPAQTRSARSEPASSQAPAHRAASADERAPDLTHFVVDAEQTQLVHRGRAVAVGQARDHFSSWLELPDRGLAAAGVRSDAAGARALVVMVDEIGAAHRELLVPSARGAAQASPKLLSPRAHGTAFGVAWFEGDSFGQRELFFARALEHDGDVAFERPLRLAGRAAGSQVALDAVTLPDGRFLATWSAFDGTDTEIFFTVGDGRSWSRPRPLHDGDDTPDSFPTLIATRDGALVAWNSLEGHTYSVVTSAFDGTSWSAPWPVVAEPGTEPIWVTGADRPVLSFRQRGEWVLVETDANGVARQRTRAAGSSRPTVVGIDDRGVVVRSPLSSASRGAREHEAREYRAQEHGVLQHGVPQQGAQEHRAGDEVPAARFVRLEWQP